VHVGDLQSTVTEKDLRSLFAPCGPIHEIKIMKEKFLQQCKGYAFVHFKTKSGQDRALELDTASLTINGRPCTVNLAEQKLTLFIGGLPNDMNQENIRQALLELCKTVTNQLQVNLKTGPPPECQSRGFGFVTFPSHEIADAAKQILTNSYIKVM